MERTKTTFNQQLCQVLKLDPNKIISLTIKVLPDSVLVTTEEILLSEEKDGVLKLLEYYHLVKTVNGNIKNKIVS